LALCLLPAHLQPESVESKGIYPTNLMRIVLKSENLRLLDAMTSSLALPDMLWYDHARVWSLHDENAFRDWATEKVCRHHNAAFSARRKCLTGSPWVGVVQHIADRFYDIILAPSLSVTLNERGNISAAEMLLLSSLEASWTPVSTVLDASVLLTGTRTCTS
jgi:hypothetical protein